MIWLAISSKQYSCISISIHDSNKYKSYSLAIIGADERPMVFICLLQPTKDFSLLISYSRTGRSYSFSFKSCFVISLISVH